MPRPEGAGRKKGQLNKRTLARIEEVKLYQEKGLTPLQVMYENMIFWHGETVRLNRRLNDFLADYERSAAAGGDAELVDLANIQKVRELLMLFLRAREMSQKCAVDSAPYVHPKLAAITVEKEVQRTIRIIGGLPPRKQLPAPSPAAEEPTAPPPDSEPTNG